MGQLAAAASQMERGSGEAACEHVTVLHGVQLGT